MKVNPINNQAFTGKYLLQFRDNKAGLIASHKLLPSHYEKVTSIKTSDSEILLLTGADHDCYEHMSKLYKGDQPLLDRISAHEKIVETLKEEATVIDFKNDKFYV